MLVSTDFSLPRIRIFLVTLFLAALGISGCEDAYSPAVRYLVRTDPLVQTQNLGEDRPRPDRPGQLPLMATAELFEVPNLYFEKTAGKPEDMLRNKFLDPGRLTAAQRKELQEALDENFGTPQSPKVDGVDDAVVQTLKLEQATLKKGSRYYRIHCLHCHGLTGNGRGPTARWINPHPRDYRPGLFKFQSVDQTQTGNRKPLRSDLLHTLEEGIEGTPMPSFGQQLSQGDLESLVSYVIHLSIRGEAEFGTIQRVLGTENPPGPLVSLFTKKIAGNWLKSQKDPIKLKNDYPIKEGDDRAFKQSVQRGQALFLADEARLKEFFPAFAKDANKLRELKGASCISCHKDYGRQADFRFDAWGTLVRPADLTRGVYRGGRRPIDLYHRLHSGINGSGMAQFGGNLSEEQIWDLVNFVRILPYPMRKQYGIDIN